jgi:RAT1-interacting protein
VGFRTPGGVVSTIQSFKTVEIPRLVRDKPSAWDPLLCLDWAGRFLTNLRRTIAAEEPSSGPKVWRVWFTPGFGTRLRELNATEMADVEHGEDRVGFLPRWYWAGLGQGAVEPREEALEGKGTDMSAGLPRD